MSIGIAEHENNLKVITNKLMQRFNDLLKSVH